MRKILCSIPISLFVITSTSWGQSTLDKLTVEKIMRDAKWLGSSPFSPRWSADAKTLYFNWNPEKAVADSGKSNGG